MAQLSLEPMGIEIAHILVTRILAGYPYLSAHDPQGYRCALEEVMSQYPRWAGERAILRVDEERPEFPPSDRVLRTWLDDAVRPHRFVSEWDARSRAQIRERQEQEQLEADKPVPSRPVGITYDARRFYDAVAAHGRPFGAFETGRQLPYHG